MKRYSSIYTALIILLSLTACRKESTVQPMNSGDIVKGQSNPAAAGSVNLDGATFTAVYTAPDLQPISYRQVNSVQVDIVITNNGRKEAPACRVRIAFDCGVNSVVYANLPSIPGSTNGVTVRRHLYITAPTACTNSEGRKNFVVTVDPDNQVFETIENNNTMPGFIDIFR